MKPKVAIIHPRFFVYGGAERQIAYMCNWLTDHDYPITILTMQMIPEMKRALKDTRYIAIPNQQQFAQFVRSTLRKFDIINPHNHPAEFVHIPDKVPCVWQHNEPPDYILAGGELRAEERYLTQKYVDKVVVISDFEKKRFTKNYGFEPIVNYPGVKGKMFSEEVDAISTDVCGRNLQGYKVLLEPGYLTWTKNQIKAVQVLADIKKEYPKSVLVLAGHDKDPYTNKVKAEAKELGVEKDVLITGYIKDDYEFRNLYHLADVCLAPVEAQGAWASTFESMCTGTPTIVSETFVASNLVKDHNLGIVSSLEDFSKNTLKQLDNPTKFDYKWIVDNLTWDNFSSKYDEIFTEMYEG